MEQGEQCKSAVSPFTVHSSQFTDSQFHSSQFTVHSFTAQSLSHSHRQSQSQSLRRQPVASQSSENQSLSVSSQLSVSRFSHQISKRLPRREAWVFSCAATRDSCP